MYVPGQMDTDDADVTALRFADIEIEGQLATASNTTLRGILTRDDGTTFRCVYKPVRGERPLWDFPEGTLTHREIATYEMSRVLGLDVVPLTVWRDDGPFGPGMCQRWIDVNYSHLDVDLFPAGSLPAGHLAIMEAQDESGRAVVLGHSNAADLRSVAFLDVLANNADRKAGHLMRDAAGRLWAIDHGVTFHHEPKLRTVLWGWSGSSMLDHVGHAASRSDDLHTALEPWLPNEDINAFFARLDYLSELPKFPSPPIGRPAVPWPVF